MNTPPTLHPFTSTPTCAKCGNGDIAWCYFEALPIAHHHMQCRRCSWAWLMRCKPKPKEQKL